jgi:CDP-diacylglycerol---glycerol-3-phosphate 3-phosphatidyltransferase
MIAWLLTLSRLPLAALFALAVALLAGGPAPLTWSATAALLALAVVAECTDLLDGYLARRSGRQSELGGLADPLCDSLARLTMYFSLALAHRVWIGVPLLMAGRDLLVAYVRVVLALAGGRTSARASGKAKAIVQGIGIVLLVLLASPAAPADAGQAAAARWAVAAAVLFVTLWSLADYLRVGLKAARQLTRQADPPAKPPCKF